MGNCCRRESSMVWASVDDEWNQSVTPGKEKESLLSDDRHYREEVKIKITKRQLQEFLGRVDMEDLTTEQALCQLVNAGAGNLSDFRSHRPWRPRLHSIPEVD